MTWAAVNPAVNPGLLPQRCHVKNPQQVWWQAQRDGFSLAHKQERPVKDMTMDKALFPTEDLSFRANVRVFLLHSCSTGAVVTCPGLLYLLHGHLEKLWFLQSSTK